MNKTERDRPTSQLQIVFSPEVVKQNYVLGLESNDQLQVGTFSMVPFAFIFQCRAVSVAHVRPGDIVVTDEAITITLIYCKQKAHRSPVRLRFPTNSAWTRHVYIMRKKISVRPHSPGFFDLRLSERLGSAHLGQAISSTIALASISVPEIFFYGSHSSHIEGYNELLSF